MSNFGKNRLNGKEMENDVRWMEPRLGLGIA